jgi:hypothetical protein
VRVLFANVGGNTDRGDGIIMLMQEVEQATATLN